MGASRVPPVPDAAGRNAAPVVRPAGRNGLLVEVGAGEVARWTAALTPLRETGEVVDVVPGAATVLLEGVADPAGLVRRLAGWDPPAVAADDGPLVEIDVVYDGPDLAEVARRWGTDDAGVVSAHTATVFRVAFTGFAPGFGYLSGLAPQRHVPRRASPRTRVPAGSVGLAGEWSGVYPRDSPGGWQLIGRTGAVLFDPDRSPPALLSPGTRVHFRARPGGAQPHRQPHAQPDGQSDAQLNGPG